MSNTLKTNPETMTVPSIGGGRISVNDTLMRYGMIAVLGVLIVVGQLLYPAFLTLANISNILSQSAPVGIIAVGMTLVMITGGFDLSVGALYAAGATFYASLAVGGVPLPVAFGATIALGLTAGAFNGFIIVALKVNPFVATLGTSSIIAGLAYIYSGSRPYVVADPAFNELGRGNLFGVPFAIWILVVLLAVGQFILSKTVYGRSLFAIGGNNEAARLAGLRVNLLRASTYVIVGACSALAGMIIASRLSVGQADIGANIALDAIAVVIIGGTSLLGGEGAMWRTAIGLLIIGGLANLMDSLAIDSNGQLLIKGVIVILAVSLDALGRRRRS